MFAIGTKVLAGKDVPEVSVYTVNERTSQSSRRSEAKRRISSLKFNMQAYIAAAVLVLAINISWLVWAKLRYAPVHGVGLGFGEIFQGDCGQANKIDTYLHLLINVLSTLLLSGSNFFLASYSSPTRKEIDRAHRAGHWLHIGLHSLRNLFHISWLKIVVCLLLVSTSLPFSLISNSLIFTSTSATEYRWAIVTNDFLQNGHFTLNSLSHVRLPHWKAVGSRQHGPWGHKEKKNEYLTYKLIQQEASGWEKLGVLNCFDIYNNQQVLTSRRNLVLVSSNKSDHGSLLNYGYVKIDDALNGQSTWRSDVTQQGVEIRNGKHLKGQYWIEFCLSELIEPHCSVRFSWNIMALVIVCNMIKILILAFILARIRIEGLLVTIGDAMASFLLLEDPVTSDWQLTGKSETESWKQFDRQDPYKTNKRGHRQYHQSISEPVWSFYTIAVVLISALVFIGLQSATQRAQTNSLSFSKSGFGRLNGQTLVFSNGIVANVAIATIVANLPQLLLSAMYLFYQGILTALFLAREWEQFSIKDKPLMVSSPSQTQRGTWLFGVPFWPGLILQIFQMVYHWVVSQAIFPVRLELFDAKGHSLHKVLHNCAYSPQAIAVSLMLVLLLVIVPLYYGLRTLKGDKRQPFVGTRSVLISAGCHHFSNIVEKADGLVQQKLRWSIVTDPHSGKAYSTFIPAKEGTGQDNDCEKLNDDKAIRMTTTSTEVSSSKSNSHVDEK